MLFRSFTMTGFDPLTWKPNYPNPAFLEMTPQDAYWGAKRVMSFSNEDIRVVVEQGQFSNPAVTDYITKILIARRDLVGKAWFSQVAPLENFVVTDGKLRFTDLGQKYGVLSASIYSYSWFSFDNRSGSKSPVAAVSSDSVPEALASSSEGSFMGCTLTDTKQTHRTVTVVFRREGSQWKLVGIERTSS